MYACTHLIFLPADDCVRAPLYVFVTYQGAWGAVAETMAQIKKGEWAKGVMTRKREPRVPKATCCSLALVSWCGGPCLILCCA